MAWVIAADVNDDLVLSEEATGGGTNTKTLVWPTDVSVLHKERSLQVEGVRVELTTDGTGGNTRRVELQVLDSADDIVGATQSAATVTLSTTQNFEFSAGFIPDPANTELIAGSTLVRSPLGRVILAPGMKLKVLDAAATSTGDQLIAVHVRARYLR